MLSTLSSSLISFLTQNRYRKEMTMVLFLKAIGLFLLWFFFFAQPIDERLTTSQLADHFITTLT